MRRILLYILLVMPACLRAQTPQKWNLRSCIDYAMANNISVKQTDVQAKLSNLTYQQSKLGQYPSLSFGTNSSLNSGNNQDPTTFSRVTETYLSAGFQLQTSADIFNFFSKRNTIAANQWQWMAAKASVDKIKNDVALSVANAYLQILLAQEMEKIAGVQVKQTLSQLEMTRKRVQAGSLPPLNQTQLEAQLASDSSSLVSAQGSVESNKLNLKSLMNLDAATVMEIETPPVDLIPVEPIAELQPDFVYTQALANQPQQKANDYSLKAALKSQAAAHAMRLPSVSAFGSLSTNYLAFHQKAQYAPVITGYTSTGLVADAGGGVLYDVQSPVITKGDIIGYTRPSAFGTQLQDNFRRAVGLSISVPIFNGGSMKTNYERSKLTVTNARLQQEADNQKLKQDIYQAFNAASVAMQKYNASSRAVAANEQAFELAGKRYEVGMLSTYDLITTQNNLLRSKMENTLNHFDYVFKMKVLEFYKGVGLKL